MKFCKMFFNIYGYCRLKFHAEILKIYKVIKKIQKYSFFFTHPLYRVHQTGPGSENLENTMPWWNVYKNAKCTYTIFESLPNQ